MDAIPYSTARKHFVEKMEQVCENHEPLIVTRKGARSVVIMSLEDYNSIEETAYLLRSPKNAARLRESIRQHQQGKVKKHKLLKDDQA